MADGSGRASADVIDVTLIATARAAPESVFVIFFIGRFPLFTTGNIR